jgi:hypothetical protein
MASSTTIQRAIHDGAKIARAHRLSGSEAQRELRKGRSAHVFNDDVDIDTLENAVWRYGVFMGSLGNIGQRGTWDRFVWRSPTVIGRRVQHGKADVPLFWVEVKGKQNAAGDWVYHLVPRTRPPK